MLGIIIAAGLGSRMGVFSQTRPKCLLPIAGRTLLERTIENLQKAGCQKVIVVVGHKSEMIQHPDIEIVRNDDYRNNNILHSLMYAREHLNGPIIVSYSDIWVEPHIHQTLVDTDGDIVAAVDRDWLPYYEGRTKHPVSEAENIYYDSEGVVHAAGKHLKAETGSGLLCGEFLGLWRMSAEGTEAFKQAFEKVDAELDPLSPFEQAAEWRKSYITDMLQHLADRNTVIQCAFVERGWAELDTEQDYQRLQSIAERQRLRTLTENGAG